MVHTTMKFYSHDATDQRSGHVWQDGLGLWSRVSPCPDEASGGLSVVFEFEQKQLVFQLHNINI